MAPAQWRLFEWQTVHGGDERLRQIDAFQCNVTGLHARCEFEGNLSEDFWPRIRSCHVSEL